MSPQELYTRSTAFNTRREQLVALNNQLVTLNLLRFKYFVDASPAGFACTYALITHKAYTTEGERSKSIEYLERIRDHVDTWIKELKLDSQQ